MARDKIHVRTINGATQLGVAVTGPHAGHRVHKTGANSIWLRAGKATDEELQEAFDHTNATFAERTHAIARSIFGHAKSV